MFLCAVFNRIYVAKNKILGIYNTAFNLLSLVWIESVIRNINDKEFILNINFSCCSRISKLLYV